MIKKVSKISIDPNKCILCGTCTVVSPKVFEFGKDDHTQVTTDALNEPVETIIAGAQACPTGAITVLDEDGKTLYPAK